MDENMTSDEKSDDNYVAIKKIKNIFESDFVGHRILREIKLLRILKGHKNVSKEHTLFLKKFIIYIYRLWSLKQ